MRCQSLILSALLLVTGLLAGCTAAEESSSPCRFDIYRDQLSCNSNS